MSDRSNRHYRIAVLATVCLLLGPGVPAAADDVASFYAGRTLEMIVGYPPAGSNDIYARIVACHTFPSSVIQRVKSIYK